MKNSRAVMMLVVAMVAGLAAVVFASHWLVQTSTSRSRRSRWPTPT